MRAVFIAFALLCGQAHAAVFRRVQEVRYNVGKLAEPIEISKLDDLAPLVTEYTWPLDPTMNLEERVLIGESLLTGEELVGSMRELKPMIANSPAIVRWLPFDSLFEVETNDGLKRIRPAYIDKHKMAEVRRFLHIFENAGMVRILRALDGKK